MRLWGNKHCDGLDGCSGCDTLTLPTNKKWNFPDSPPTCTYNGGVLCDLSFTCTSDSWSAILCIEG